tara:strand:+ start:935 stop:1462 length:528 start_codon:yes stop_codon:yes gene_type:complete
MPDNFGQGKINELGRTPVGSRPTPEVTKKEQTLPTESSVESAPERTRVSLESESSSKKSKKVTPLQVKGKPESGVKAILPTGKTQARAQIEQVLSAGMTEAYQKMQPELQQSFKAKGEVVAKEVEDLLGQAKVKAKRIFKLIVEWLRMVPGVSKFFLQQEAKIKTDKLLRLNQKR